MATPCEAGYKARGVTGSPNPTGDAFDVDYVAHEIGHQFGGNHTYNGNAGSCNTRWANHAYEVGSGATIQAYAGICGVENLQRNSIDRFHVESLNEMTAFITEGMYNAGGPSCGEVSATGNSPPTVNAGADYTIPARTPFMLTAIGSDPNGDTLTYAWEQFDRGAASNSVATATTDDGTRPLFRPYQSTTSPVHYFPSLTYILNKANAPPPTYNCSDSTCFLTGETLPTTSRTMNFQVTARDNRSGGGAIATDRMTVTTVSTGAPFVVTSQNTATTVTGNTQMTVTWNVAGTTAAPISAANVSIAISTDGGVTFTTVLASTPNNGSAQVTVPNEPTTQGRVRVMGVNNIFFDINDANFTITSGGPVVTASVSPSTLNFAATKAGASGAISHVTAAQTVTVGFSSGAPAWTVTTSQPWVSLSTGAGAGAGTFTVGIQNPSNVLGGSTSVQATVTLTSAGASNSPRLITVNLTIDQTNGATPSAPFGQVDTPVQNALGVQGAIGVTGWALDNVGVTGVKIYRNCLPFEDVPEPDTSPCNYDDVLGQRVVYVGEAAFLAGARTDVEAAFSTFPQNNRAGWGYLMLTLMLPHVDNQQPYGGQGALTIYAVATDAEGNRTLLGRSSDPASPAFATPTAITMANDSIAKPFGAIDTPAQGQTISGTFHNFGWALTPDTNSTGGDPGDIFIPTNGSTMTVFLNAQPSPWPTTTALVTYNQCRVGTNPTPSGEYCADDVSNIFGNPTPQPVGTLRTSNPTLFRNLDAGRSAIGSYTFNTTTMPNGLHTIAWSVTDSAGRNEGIGSRFFNVLNAGGARPEAASDLAMRPAVVRGEARALDAHAPGTDGVWGRTGYNLDAEWTPMHADAAQRYQVRLPEQGRLELWLGHPVEAGYLVAQDGTLRDLPVGSTLDGLWFGWMPPIGYVGSYHLAFLRGTERIDVMVTVVPRAPVLDGEAQIRMHLDGLRLGGRIEGWAFDPQASIGAGIGAVHVWARRQEALGLQPAFFVGTAELGVARPDVAQAMAGAPVDSGFALTASLAPGTYELSAYVWNERTARWEDARSVMTIVR